MNYPNISKNSSEIGHLLPNFLLMELNDYSEEENTSKNYTNTADVKPQKKKTNNKKKKNYDSNKKDLHYKSNINLSKNYSNSSYNKSYYINNEVQNKPSFKVKDQSYNYENSFYLGSTAKSSDSESCKARKDYFKRSSGENNTETDYDTIEDFIETHGVHLANYICTQKGSRYYKLI
jgi:hypothetical protein